MAVAKFAFPQKNNKTAENAPQAQPTAPEVQEAPQAQPTAPEVQEAPQAQPTAPEVQEAPQAQPTAPEVQEAPQAQPTAPEVQEAPQAQPAAPAVREAPQAQPTAPEEREAPQARPTAPEMEIVLLPLVSLVPYDEPNYHIDDGELSMLTADIRANGVMVPIQVMPHRGGQYMILSGHRRVIACENIGMGEIPAIVRDVTRKGAEIIFHATNILNREELTIMEKAAGYKSLMDNIQSSASGSMRKELSNVGISYRAAKRYVAILDLIEPLQELVIGGEIGLNAGSELAALPHERQQVLFRYLAGKEKKVKISEKQARVLAISDRPDFLEVVTETFEPEKAERKSFYAKINQIMEKNGIQISEDDLLNIIASALLAYKEKGGRT